MTVRRRSPAVLAYFVIAVIELVAGLVLSGGGVSVLGAAISLGLFVFLFRGSPIAWGVLLGLNTLGLFGLVVGVLTVHAPAHPVWSHVAVLGGAGVAIEAVLLSPGMRRHVASRGLRLAAPGRVSSRGGVARVGRRFGSAAAPDGPCARRASVPPRRP